MLFKNIAVAGENFEVSKNLCVLTEGEYITYIGSELPADYTGEVYDGKNKLLLPGFYNMHCHAPMSLIRGYGEGLPLDRWLHEKMFPFEALLTADDIYWGTLLAGMEMIASGAVSFNDMYFGMPSMVEAIEKIGLKCNISHGCSDLSGKNLGFADLNGYKGIQFLHEYKKVKPGGKIIPEASIHAQYTCTDRIAREVAEYAKQSGLQIHIHLSETEKEHEDCKRALGMTPAAWFDSMGVFDCPTTAAHCVWVEPDDIRLLAEKSVTAVHCPSSNLKLGSGIAPVKQMLDAGVNVAIGTDGAASNNNLNMLEEITLASLLGKGASRDPLFMGTAQTLRMATAAGAAAQGRADCGSIKVGNRADITVIDLDTQYSQPVFDELANALYSASPTDIKLTMVDGEVFYKNGEFKNIDREEVLWNARRIAGEKLELL